MVQGSAALIADGKIILFTVNSVLIPSALRAHNPDASLEHSTSLTPHYAVRWQPLSTFALPSTPLRHTEYRLSPDKSILLRNGGLLETLPDSAICPFLWMAREGFMTSRALRIIAQLGADAICYNI